MEGLTTRGIRIKGEKTRRERARDVPETTW